MFGSGNVGLVLAFVMWWGCCSPFCSQIRWGFNLPLVSPCFWFCFRVSAHCHSTGLAFCSLSSVGLTCHCREQNVLLVPLPAHLQPHSVPSFTYDSLCLSFTQYHQCWYPKPVIFQLLSCILASQLFLLSGAADNRACWVPLRIPYRAILLLGNLCVSSTEVPGEANQNWRWALGLKSTGFKYWGVNRRSVCCQWQWSSKQLYRAQQSAEQDFCHSSAPLLPMLCAPALQHPCHPSSGVAE